MSNHSNWFIASLRVILAAHYVRLWLLLTVPSHQKIKQAFPNLPTELFTYAMIYNVSTYCYVYGMKNKANDVRICACDLRQRLSYVKRWNRNDLKWLLSFWRWVIHKEEEENNKDSDSTVLLKRIIEKKEAMRSKNHCLFRKTNGSVWAYCMPLSLSPPSAIAAHFPAFFFSPMYFQPTILPSETVYTLPYVAHFTT